MSATNLETIVNFSKRKGFVFQSSEIYGGFAATYDYGPLGFLLKNNLVKAWRDWNVNTRTDNVEIEGAIFLHPKVWQASGHIAGFADLMVEDLKTHKRYRADHLVEDAGVVWPLKSDGVNYNTDDEALVTIDLKPEDIEKPRKRYIRAVIYNPKTKKFLFSYFGNIQGENKYGLIGGSIDEGEDEIEALKREILEETGFVNFKIIGKLGGSILSPKDPEFDTKDIIKENAAYLVVLNSIETSQTNFTDSEITNGFSTIWEDPKNINFGGFYKQYQVFLNRGLEYLKYQNGDKVVAATEGTIITNAGSFTAEEIDQIIEHYNLKSPDGNPVSKAKSFNLLVKTHLGPVEDETTVAYLKGESCQNIYVDWKLVQETTRRKLPFGIAQLGKAFRNEVTVKQFMFRTREFEQIDLQYFVKPGEEDKWYDYWKQNHYQFYTQKLKFKPENLQWYQHSKEELAFYAKDAWDIYYKYGALGFKEMQGFHNRTDYDTKVHQELSGQDLTYLDPFTNERFLPYIVEMSAGLNRMFLALLFEFYTEEEIGEGDRQETRIVMKFPYDLAPYKLAVLPLMKKDGLAEIATDLYAKLRSNALSVDYDEAGSIGKRYRRQDENGTPFCVTIDYDTRDNGLVTIRNRDTMAQETIKIEEIEEYLNNNKN